MTIVYCCPHVDDAKSGQVFHEYKGADGKTYFVCENCWSHEVVKPKEGKMV